MQAARLRFMLPLLAAGMWCIAGKGYAAGELLEHYQRAKYQEPLFQAAKAEREANLAGSQAARTALFPELRLSTSRLETENSTRTTLTVVQPIVDANRYATYRESEPREVLAEATYQAREQELALRYMKSVTELVRARESLALNQARIDAFAEQARSATRAYELGTGTVTDLRDAQVRLDQARAADLTLGARLSAAERQFAAITGTFPRADAFRLVRKRLSLSLESPMEYLAKAEQANVQLIAARQNERIAQLGITRAKGAFLPTINATATRTHTSFDNDQYVGVQLNFPLQTGNFYQVFGAVANADRQAEQARDALQRARLEVERLYQLVEAGRNEVGIRLDGIRSAELSVQANEKSFRGGIRSKVDVINSIQIHYQVMEEHLNAVLTLADNLLNLHIQTAHPIPDSLQQIERILFEPA
ncbi:MAG: TolC family protein [Burkholderiaceae bacterium]